jgi:hypothetical protein
MTPELYQALYHAGVAAAEASRDAHGELVPALQAYYFMREEVSVDQEEYETLPESPDGEQWAAFVAGYTA